MKKGLIREKCILCGCTTLDSLYTFESFPVYMGVSNNENVTDDMFADMIWMVCKACGCIQLKNLIDLSIIYHKGHNSAYGKTWEKHHKQFANFINRYCGNSILEIGGGNLKLAEFVADLNQDLKFTVFDTNCNKSHKQNIITKEEFFDYNNYKLEYSIDTIVHSHVLEHLYNPMEYISTFYSLLKYGQKMIMSVPLLDNMVRANFTNSLNFEHTYMLSESLLSFILNNAGFKIIDKKLFNPFNMFIVCEKVFNSIKNKLINNYERNLNLFFNFIKFHKEFIEEVNKVDNNLYVFGGHIFTQYLFAFGLDPKKCICVLDNDPNKIDKRLYGTNLFIKSPKILRDLKEPIVVLRTAQFSKEIKDDILKNINSNTRFIE